MLPSSSWVHDALKNQTIVNINREEIKFSIYAQGRDAKCNHGGVQRIDMSMLACNPTCKADKIFWEAAVELYQTRLKFIPKDEAHQFVEQCWRMHLCKTWRTIYRHRLETLLRLGKRAPVFSDVVILSLLYGNDTVRQRSWYSHWALAYNDDWKMPQKLQGLWTEENLPEDAGPTGLRRKITPSEKGREVEKTAKPRNGSPQDEKDDDEPWMTMPSARADTPPMKLMGNVRRQSALDSEKRIRRLYNIYPTEKTAIEENKTITIRSTPPSIKPKRTAHLLDDSEDDLDDIARKPRKANARMSQSEQLPNATRVVTAPGESGDQRLGRSQTVSLPGEKDSSTDASDESTPDTEAVTERAQDSEGTDAYLKQFKDDLAERQSVIAQIEALQAEKTAKLAERNALEEKLKAVEKELEAAYEKLKTVWDRPWA